MRGKGIKKVFLFTFLPLFFPLSSFALQEKFPKGEERLRIKLPPVVIMGEERLRAQISKRLPLPSILPMEEKERPSLNIKGVEREIDKLARKAAPSVRGPGCAYSTGVGATFARIFEGTEALYKRGIFFYLRGERTRAGEVFSTIVRKYPTSPFAPLALYWLGEMAFEEGDLPKARLLYLRVFERYPDSLYADYALYSAAWIELKGGEREKAFSHFDIIPKRYPESPLLSPALLWKGYLLLDRGEYGEAHKVLANLRGIEARWLDGIALFHLGQFRRSADALTPLPPKGHPLREGGLYVKGWALLQGGDAKGALEYLNLYLEDYPQGKWQGPVRWGIIKALLQEEGGERAQKEHKRLFGGGEYPYWSSLSLYEIALHFRRKGKYGSMVYLLEEALKGEPKDLTPSIYLYLGEALARVGEYGKAARAFRNFVRRVKSPEEILPSVLLNLGLSLYHDKEVIEAVRAWKRVVSEWPQRSEASQALYFLGEVALELGDPDRAWGYFSEIEESSGLFPQALLSMGWFHFKAGEWEKAIKWFEQLENLYPSSPLIPQGRLFLALAYFNGKKYGRASKILGGLLEAKDEHIRERAFFYKALCHYKREEFQEGIKLLRELIKRWPKSPSLPHAYFWMGWSYYRMKRFKEAVDAFWTVAERYPDHPLSAEALVKIGDCYYNMGQYRRAALAYLRLKRRKPKSPHLPDALWGIVLSLYRMGDEEGLRAWSEELRKSFPTHPLTADCLLLLGNYFEKKGKSEEAERYFRELLEGFPSERKAEEARLRLSSLLLSRGKASEALSLIRPLVSKGKGPYFYQAIHKIGEIYHELGQDEEALRYWRRVVEEAPREMALGCASKMADIYEGRGELAGAHGILRKAIDRFPRSPIAWPLWLKLGEVDLKRGDYEGAIRAFRQLLALAPRRETRAYCQLRIAEAYFRWGKRKEALEEAFKGAYLYPDQKEEAALALLLVAEIYNEEGKEEKAVQACKKALHLSPKGEVKQKAEELLRRIRAVTGE